MYELSCRIPVFAVIMIEITADGQTLVEPESALSHTHTRGHPLITYINYDISSCTSASSGSKWNKRLGNMCGVLESCAMILQPNERQARSKLIFIKSQVAILDDREQRDKSAAKQ